MPLPPGPLVQPASYTATQDLTQPIPPPSTGPAALPPPPLPSSQNPELIPPPVVADDLGVDNAAQLGVVEFFNDPLLANLVGQAMVGNRELMILNEEVAIASNEILARRGAYLPFVNFGGRAELAKPSLFTPRGAVEEQLEYAPGKHFPEPLPNFFGGFTYLWRVDIWRELRNARDAAGQRYEAVNERRNFFITRLVADIAENYYDLMALDKRLENLDQTIQLQEKSLEIAKAKKEAGRGTELAVQRFEAEVRKNQSEKLAVFQEIIEAENRINFLVNRLPQPVERSSARFYELELAPMKVGIPPELLANRADIREAERELVAAGLDVQVARAHFFPTLDITGAVGYEAFNPKYLFWTPESLIYSVAGDLVGPVVNKKAIQAEFLTANAEQLKAMYDYQRVVLNAFTEVVNRVARLENYGRSVAIRREQLLALEASVESANNLFQNPREEERVEYLEVLLAQRDLRDARMGLIDAKREQLTATVQAYQALGGGVFLSNSLLESP
jgi:multidrug efflux system outer membrane protein